MDRTNQIGGNVPYLYGMNENYRISYCTVFTLLTHIRDNWMPLYSIQSIGGVLLSYPHTATTPCFTTHCRLYIQSSSFYLYIPLNGKYSHDVGRGKSLPWIIRIIDTAMLMEACVVLLRVSYRMFHKQGISGQHRIVCIINTATLMEACVVINTIR